MRSVRRFTSVALLGAVAACVSKPEPAPAPPSRVTPPIAQPAPSTPPPPVRAWADLPLTPGSWLYASDAGGSRASFGVQASEARFVLRCDRAARRIFLSRAGGGSQLTVRTSYGARTLAATSRAEPLPYATASLAVTDTLLDEIAFSRGRIAIEGPGQPQLILPAWPEPARVVEDCRA